MKHPEYIDIHCHANFAVYDADRAETVRRALDSRTWMINVGTTEATSRKAVEMTREFPEGVYATVGLHPIYVNPTHPDRFEEGEKVSPRGEDFDPGFYRALIREAGRKIVGIGECGLDYYHAQTPAEHARQRAAFIAQIELALELDLPLMLHIRSGAGDAYRDVIDILRPYKERYGDRLRGDTHFFAGTVEDAREFLGLGFYVSFTGVVTFAKQYIELVRAVPDDRIMTETDSPYVSPVPHRGKRCEPSFVREVTHKMADIKGVPLDAFKKQVVENAIKLFKLTSKQGRVG